MTEEASLIEDLIRATNQQIAVKKVDALNPQLVADVGPMYLIKRNLHLGVDAQGERLTPEDRRVLQETLEALEQKLANTYSHSNILDLHPTLASMGLNNPLIKEEVIKRTET